MVKIKNLRFNAVLRFCRNQREVNCFPRQVILHRYKLLVAFET